MKNLLKSLALVAVSALAVVSCQKDELAGQNDGEGVFFSLRTGDAGKTYIVAGEGEDAGKYLPKWNKGDKVKVFFGDPDGTNNTPYGPLTNQNEDGQTADFQGTIKDAPDDGYLYAFYPTSSFVKVYADKSVGLKLPAEQQPTATSFDPDADILVSQKTKFMQEDGVWAAYPKFARVPAVLKINVFSSSFTAVQGDILSKFTVESSSNDLAGNLAVDLVNGYGKVAKVNGPSKSVSAVYDTERYISVGTDATSTNCSVFLLVNAGELAAGSTLTFTGVGATYNIKKVINIDEVVEKTGKPFVLTSGNLTEINLSLIEENCEVKVDYSGSYLIVSENHLLTDYNDNADKSYYNYTDAEGTKLADFWEIAGIDDYVWTVDKLDDGSYSFCNNGTGKYLALTANSNNAHEADNANENTARFSITAEESALTIYSKAYPERKLRCNTSSPRFAFYSSNTGTVATLMAYTPDPRPTFDTVSGLSWDASGKTLSWTAAEGATNGYEYSKDNGETVTASETNSIDCSSWTNGDYSVKVRVVGTEEKKTSEWSEACEFTISGGVAAKYYRKVTEDLGDWSGTYLIVCGTSAANGTIESKWLKYITVTVDSQNGILSDSSTDAVATTIAEVEAGIYNIQFANGKYLGTTDSNDGIKVADSAGNDFKWKFSFNNGLVKIENTIKKDRHLRLGTSGFRTYTGTTGTQATLYKLDEVAVTSITVSGTPTKTSYKAGDNFETAGLVATATYEDASTEDVTNKVVWTVEPTPLTAGTTSVSVVATYKKVSSTAYVVNGLTVTEPATLKSISVKTAPTKVTYKEGEKFDPTGLVITRNYSDATSDDYAYAGHESEFAFSPDLTTALSTTHNKVTITYKEKSVDQEITVEDTSLKTMDEIFAAATKAGSTATNAKVKFNNWVVSGVKGDNVYVTDGTKGLIIYTSNHGFTVGDVLSGTVSCKIVAYQGSSELKDVTKGSTGLSVTKGGTITPATIAIADLTGAHTGAVITFESLQYNGSVFTDGKNTIKPYNMFDITMPTLTSGKNYTVTGVYVHYNGTREIVPRATNDIVPFTGPYLNASASKTSGIAAAGETVTITVDTNIEGWTVKSDNAAFVVGAKSGNTVPVTVSENTSTTDERTAKITVSAEGVDDVVITLTQSKAGEVTVTWVAKDASDNPGDAKDWFSGSIDANISWAATKGGSNNPKYYSTGTGLRVYNGGTFTVSAANGKKITKIILTFSGTSYTFSSSNTITPQTYELSSVSSKNWSVSRTCRLQKVEVTYE